MIEEVTNQLVKLIRGALLPTTLSREEMSSYGCWKNKTEITGPWLTQIIHNVRCDIIIKNVETDFMNFLCCDIMNPWQWSVMSLSSLIQELSWSSVCHGNSKWFAPSDSGSATGVKSSLPHCDSAAHSRRSVLLTYKMLTLTYI